MMINASPWQRYMIEIRHFVGAEKQLLSLLPDSDEGSLELAEISRDLMGIYERTGRSERAVASAQVEFGIFESHGLGQDNGTANAYSDMVSSTLPMTSAR